MEWRKMFGFKPDKKIDVAVAAMHEAVRANEASRNRLEETIRRVLDEKTGRDGAKRTN